MPQPVNLEQIWNKQIEHFKTLPGVTAPMLLTMRRVFYAGASGALKLVAHNAVEAADQWGAIVAVRTEADDFLNQTRPGAPR